MGIYFGNADAKNGKVFLFVIVLVILLSEVSSIQRKIIDCRKFVFAPPCRGIAAKRDTRTSDLRFSAPVEESDYFMESQKIPANENFENVNGLMGLLKKAISKNIEYDTGTNYLA